ncbi:peptidoglycan DD-metalloendopeptidase family protein [bacterium]|nr:peptidoglycan DD-metalloendopeptidase family protein [bacterium]
MKQVPCISVVLVMTMTTGSIQAQNALEKTRQEIRRLEKEIREKQSHEQSLMEQIEDINREIGLRKKLMKNLASEKAGKEKDIRGTQTRLGNAQKQENALRDLIARRFVSMYKHGRKSDWEMLFTLSSVNQVLIWVRYQKLIVANDRRNLRLLKEKQQQIAMEASRLHQEIEAKESLIRSTEREADILEERSGSQHVLLNRVRQDAGALRQQLEDRRKAYSEIQRRIQQEQAQVKPRAPGRKVTGDGRQFSTLKGKMKWPVAGKVVSRHGIQYNTVLKTETDNLGIDIETTPSAAISPPCLGIVRYVWWQRGMGNLVMVDHGNNYYTVYGYLDMVLVDTGAEVDSETIIGHVGDTGSLYGATLHFEIWRGESNQNPEIWLR